MVDIDWLDPTASEGTIIVEMISQHNLDVVIGELTGVNLEDSYITYSYYSKCRLSGRLSLVDSNWVRGPFLRIKYRLPKYNYERVLGTFVVTDESPDIKQGQYQNQLTLQSAALYTCSTDIMPHDWTINSGVSARTTIHQMLNSSERPYLDKATNDHTFGTPTLMENNTSLLNLIYALASQANVRLDATEHGEVLIQNYIAPSAKSPVYTLDLADKRGAVLDGVTAKTDYFENPGRVVVEYKGQDNTISDAEKQRRRKANPDYRDELDIIGEADATPGSYTDFKTRGYQVTKFITLSDMTPSTQSKANQVAQEQLRRAVSENITWTLSTIYLPISIGDRVELSVSTPDKHYNGTRHCFATTIELSLDSMRMKMELKEVSAYDKDTDS